jgi:hypothetical protein
MPITRINPVSPRAQPVEEKEKSNFDKVMEALSLASTALKIPADIQQIRAYQGQIETSELENRETRLIQAGKTTPTSLQGKGFSVIPDVEQLPRHERKLVQEVLLTTIDDQGRTVDTNVQIVSDKQLADLRKRYNKSNEDLSKNIQTFRNSTEYRDQLGRVIEASALEKLLSLGSPAGDFGAGSLFIRGSLAEAGIVTEPERLQVGGRLSLPDQVQGFFNKWVNGEFLQPKERTQLMSAAKSLANQGRVNLDKMERLFAKNQAEGFGDLFTKDEVFERVDTRNEFNVALKGLEGTPGAQEKDLLDQNRFEEAVKGPVEGTVKAFGGEGALNTFQEGLEQASQWIKNLTGTSGLSPEEEQKFFEEKGILPPLKGRENQRQSPTAPPDNRTDQEKVLDSQDSMLKRLYQGSEVPNAGKGLAGLTGVADKKVVSKQGLGSIARAEKKKRFGVLAS